MPRARDLLLEAFTMLWSNDLRKARLAMPEPDLRAFYDELAGFLEQKYGVARDTALDAIVETQVALMPRTGKAVPLRASLAHDAVAYFEQFRAVGNLGAVPRSSFRPLREFGPGTLDVTDPGGLCTPDRQVVISNPWVVEWELSSPLELERVLTPPSSPTSQRRVLPVTA
jgi:hypothetical protein